MPEAITRDGLKWHVRLCLTVPPAAPPLLSIGHQGLLRVKEKILMFFHLTRANTAQFLQPGQEPLSVVVPIVYDIEHNNTTVAHNHKEMNPVVSAGNFEYFDEKKVRFSLHLKCQFFFSTTNSEQFGPTRRLEHAEMYHNAVRTRTPG